MQLDMTFALIAAREWRLTMTNYEYVKAVEPSERALNTIEEAVDDMCISETERKIFKDLLIALIRNERSHAALEIMEQIKYNHDCN